MKDNSETDEQFAVVTMEDVFVYIMQAHDQNQHHVTKGYALGELNDLGILKYAGGELVELAEVVGHDDDSVHNKNFETRLQEELGDTMSCLIHLAVKHDIRPNELARTIIKKLSKRFA